MKFKFNKFELTSREIFFALAIAGAGLAFSMREFILFLNGLSPIEGLAVYYTVLFLTFFILSRFKLTVFDKKIEKLDQVLGLTILTFAFFIVIGWSSAYIQHTATGSSEGISNIYFQSEDGATWFFYHDVLGIKDIETSRILAFVATPFVLGLIGGLLTTKKLEIKK